MKKQFNVLYAVLTVALVACTAAPAPTATPSPAATSAPVASATSAPTATTPAPTAAAPTQLVVLAHDAWAVTPDVLALFEQAHGVKVEVRKLGDAGQVLQQVLLDRQGNSGGRAPLGDVLYGVDNSLLSRALDAGVFEAYQPSASATISAAFKLDPQGRATPIDYGDVCINYDKAYFVEHNLALPNSLEALARPEYRDLLVVENAQSSSTGLAFVLATVAQFGPERFANYWRSLKANGVKVVEDWTTAYYTEFSGSSGRGPRPMVVSYASSPPAEVYFAPTPEPGQPALEDAPTGSLTAPGMCFRQIEFAGVLAGTPNATLAQQFIDFMLTREFQEDMPLNMFVFPVVPEAVLPEVFTRYAAQAEKPGVLMPAEIAAGREQWVQTWVETVLR